MEHKCLETAASRDMAMALQTWSHKFQRHQQPEENEHGFMSTRNPYFK